MVCRHRRCQIPISPAKRCKAVRADGQQPRGRRNHPPARQSRPPRPIAVDTPPQAAPPRPLHGAAALDKTMPGSRLAQPSKLPLQPQPPRMEAAGRDQASNCLRPVRSARKAQETSGLIHATQYVQAVRRTVGIFFAASERYHAEPDEGPAWRALVLDCLRIVICAFDRPATAPNPAARPSKMPTLRCFPRRCDDAQRSARPRSS